MSMKDLLQTRSLRYSAGLYLLFNSLFLALVLIKPWSFSTFTILDDMGVGLSGFFALLFCLIGFKVFQLHLPHTRFSMMGEAIHLWAPVFIAIGFFCQIIGQAIYTYYDFNHLTVFPSWADIPFLSAFPLLFIGIVYLPSSPSTSAARWCILLDSLIIMLTIVTFSWYFGLGAIILQGKESPLAKGLGSAFPFLDLLLIFSAILLALRTHDLDLRPVVHWLILALLLIITADSIYDYLTLQHSYQDGWQDIFWPLGYMLLGLSILTWNVIRNQKQIAAEEREERRQHFPSIVPTLLKVRSSKWNAVLPYALIPAVELLTIYVLYRGATFFLTRGVYIGNIVLISLVVFRQIFALHQARRYNHRLYCLQGQDENRNEALDQESANLMADFLILANHELRTPLTGIKGNLQLVQRRLERIKKYNEAGLDHVSENVEQTQKPLASASRSVLQQESMINAMIDHARIQSNILTLSKKLCDLCTIVEDAVTQRQASVPEHQITLELPSQREPVPIMADEGRITQVINTYLTNALNYSPPERPVGVRLRVERTTAQVAVHDEGAGIPLQDQEHLWQAFYRAKGMSIQHDLDLSLGLGLYLCREFIERHGGKVGVQSLPGHGATFWFLVPLYQ